MRTSRISRDTDRVLRSLRSSSSRIGNRQTSGDEQEVRRRARTGFPQPQFKIASNGPAHSDSDLSTPPRESEVDDEIVSTYFSPRVKRERAVDATISEVSKSEEVSISTVSLKRPRDAKSKARRQPAKKVKTQNGEVKVEPPTNWEEVYALTQQMRSQVLAPVDTMGCESLAEEQRSPRDQRFQTLIALMLSSQTKDTVTSVAMKNLQENLPGGLNLESVLAVPPAQLNSLIEKVGFHVLHSPDQSVVLPVRCRTLADTRIQNNKTRYIKAAAEILRSQFDSDIPSTIEGLVSLPGVGPKMAYLCMSAAWGRDEGIGVDVHVHRITNLWGWHKTRTPEETRAALEAWLPKEKWHEINHLLVGFGQTICLPVGRRCGECVLSEKGLCPSAVVTRTVKKSSKRATTIQKSEDDSGVKLELSTEKVESEIKSEQPGSPVVDIEDIMSYK